ncbi:MAG: leucine-rich repeat protein [Lachnospiraceae bacterium]|nr:leucine-rich repeat protein [Lachnospiraceae bacterium]
MKKRLMQILTGVTAFALVLAGLVMAADDTKPVSAATQPIRISEKNFPDPIFRKVISGPDYDRDGNGSLDAEEIGLTINIYCEGMGIGSIQGVEYFTDLQGLWCKDNQIGSMDISHNKELRGLWCSGNPLTDLDLTHNPKLLWVYCFDCNLKALDVSKNPEMAFIECNTNPITELDVSHNPLLEHLTCGSCKLKQLDLSKNPKLAHLDAFRNHLKKLDVTHNPKMKRLDIWDNEGLGSIDISQNPGLQYYNCANNDVTSIDVSHNPELTKLICSYNEISELDLGNNPKLVYLDCACNRIKRLDISGNPRLRFLQAFTNLFQSLDIGHNPYLIKTYQEGKKKSEYAVCKGHSWTIDYGGDTSTGGDNIFFLCFDDAVKLKHKSAEGQAINETAEPELIDAPENLLTREAVAVILYRMAESPSVKGAKSRFSDVEEGAWYEKALLWGEKMRICTGYPDISSDTFGVGTYVSRQDAALMLMRYSELMNYKRSIDFGRSDDYLDYYDIDFDHWEAVCWVATWNLMDGKGEKGAPKEEQRFDPLGKITRAEFEETMRRLLEKNDIPSGEFQKIYQAVLKQAPVYKVVKDEKSGAIFTIATAAGKSVVTYAAQTDQSASEVTVPDTAVIGGKKMKVGAIGANAFRNHKKLKKITIGKQIQRIGANAFFGCKNLKTVVIKTKKLRKKTVGKNAFKKINAKAKITIPSKKLKTYTSLLKARGVTGKKQRIVTKYGQN